MKDLNLLPKEYLESIEIKRLFKIIAVCAAIIFLFTILIITAIDAANSFIEGRASYLDQLSADPKYVESDVVQKEIQRREERNRLGQIILSAVEPGVYINPEHLTTVLSERPDGISALSVSADNASRRIVFEGVTTDRDLIVEYARRLNLLEVFQNVRVAKISAEGTTTRRTEFSLELVLGEAQ